MNLFASASPRKSTREPRHYFSYTLCFKNDFFFFCTKLLLFMAIAFSSENVNLLLFQSLTVLLFVSPVTPTSTT